MTDRRLKARLRALVEAGDLDGVIRVIGEHRRADKVTRFNGAVHASPAAITGKQKRRGAGRPKRSATIATPKRLAEMKRLYDGWMPKTTAAGKVLSDDGALDTANIPRHRIDAFVKAFNAKFSPK